MAHDDVPPTAAGAGVGSAFAAIRVFGPGVALALIVGTAATYVAETQQAPVMLMALLLGMIVHPVADSPVSAPGIRLAASYLLRLGVALLGLRITAAQIAGLGWSTALLVMLGVAATIGFGLAVARGLKLPTSFGLLSAGATAICGASAALAISSVLPDSKSKDADTVLSVALVTSLSTLAMIFYPGLAVLLGFDDHQAGVLFGATIHDVAQVVGAGYAVSETAGDTATVVKLFRVVLLVPVVLVIGLVAGRGGGRAGRFPLPPFVAAFAVLVLVNSVIALPDAVTMPLDAVSRWCLVTAVAALGMRTSLRDLVRAGPRPLVSVLVTTIGLLALVLLALWFGLL